MESNEAVRIYIRAVKEHREYENRVKKLRFDIRDINKKYEKTEEDLKALQSVGQIVGQILKKLPNEKFVVKSSSGPRYVVGCKPKLSNKEIKIGTRISLDMTTLTVMKELPCEVDPLVFNMISDLNTESGKEQKITYDEIGGLTEQIRQLREVVELPLLSPTVFARVGIKSPKGVLLYGPPGTGKTLLARAIASNLNCCFLRIVVSAIVDKYIGESARIIREMFTYAKEHQPCIIFMDEIDAIGGRRFSQGTSADREIQRTLMELLNHLDGFEELGNVKIIMATNRPDILDPALIRPGRLDRKIEIPLPNQIGRISILKIHANKMNISGELPYETICRLCDGFNGADLRNVCTEAGMVAIKNMRDYVTEEDFFIAARKIIEAKKLESPIEYEQM